MDRDDRADCAHLRGVEANPGAAHLSEHDSLQFVTRGDADTLLASLETLPDEDRTGFFGPASITWKVNRESAVFLGAGRAALLQLAHPWVAVALAQHSTLLNDAVGRFHSTFRVIYTMLFGTRRQALAASRQLYKRHAGIRGEIPRAIGAYTQGSHYEANETASLLWVYATLVESAILAYEFVLPPLSPAERQQYYAESKRMAALFGIPAEALPSDWNAFECYTVEMFASATLCVGPEGAALGASVLSGAGTRLKVPHWYRALTAFWMTPRLRVAFGLSYGAREERAVAQAGRWLPPVYSLAPSAFRFVGPWHEADARLKGRAPGALTRCGNQFWMGQPRMLFSEFARAQ